MLVRCDEEWDTRSMVKNTVLTKEVESHLEDFPITEFRECLLL